MNTKLSSLLLATCLGSAASLLASDPVPPPGGFAIQSNLNIPVEWSDGYKSRLDVYYPNFATPATGWPGVLVVHGGGRSRKVGWAQTTMKLLASAGYVAFGYDVRGDGQTPALNPAWGKNKGSHARRIADIADCFYRIEQARGASFDETRLGVYGQSQGGGHACRSSAWSEKILPLAGLTNRMPKISAAVSDIQVIDVIADALPGGTLFTSKAAVASYENRALFPAFFTAFASDDPVAFRAEILTQPGNYYLPQLRTSKTPILFMNSWDDGNHVVNTNADQIPTLLSGVPHRMFLTTGGHASQANKIEDEQALEMLVRWFNRFLKSRANGIDREPFAEIGVIPSKPANYTDVNHAWKHRQSQTWPRTTPSKRYYLRTAGRLLATPPAAIEPGPITTHAVTTGYSALNFVQDKGLLANVLPKIPLDRDSFTTPAVGQPTELLGRAVFEFEATASARNWQVSAVLYDVTPTGAERYITSGVVGVRQTAAGRQRARIELADVAYILPEGHRFRLSLENMHVRKHPGHVHLYTAPFFDSYRVALHIDAAFAPRLDLPVKKVEVSMTPRIEMLTASGGFSHALDVTGTADRAGRLYLVLMGASGTAPGLPTTPRIPLNFDAWTNLGLAIVNTPICARFLGVLDAGGNATPNFALPAALAGPTAGTRLSFTTLVFDGTGGFEVSGPVTLRIQP